MRSLLLTSYSPRSWFTMSSESPYAWSFLTPSPCASCKPMSWALYSATLLEQDLVRENARGMIWFWGEMNTTLTPATSPARGIVRDAPSKYICQTAGWTWDECTSAVSSGNSSKRAADFDVGFSARKSAMACPFVAFWGRKCISYCDSSMAHLVSRPLRAEGLVMRSRRGLIFDTT